MNKPPHWITETGARPTSQVVGHSIHEKHCSSGPIPAPLTAHSGTGKTWSAKQLCYCMAAALLKDDAPNKVPIFISAQGLARMMRGKKQEKGNLIQKYIVHSPHGGQNGVPEMLLEAYKNRTAILILDGLVSE